VKRREESCGLEVDSCETKVLDCKVKAVTWRHVDSSFCGVDITVTPVRTSVVVTVGSLIAGNVDVIMMGCQEYGIKAASENIVSGIAD
jgi:hypothetical protein